MQFDMSIDENIREKLGLDKKTKARNMTDEMLNLFKAAKDSGHTALSLDEITAAYYNMFTKPNGTKLKTKKDIAQKLFYMRKKPTTAETVELVPGTRGMYRLKPQQS